jgi:hypothetical protein
LYVAAALTRCSFTLRKQDEWKEHKLSQTPKKSEEKKKVSLYSAKAIAQLCIAHLRAVVELISLVCRSRLK